jgi:Predicted phage phi-C31 gp36 major capsid-like protein
VNKKKLLDLIAKKEARKAELVSKANTTEDVKELRSINAELETLNTEIAELRGIVDVMPDDSVEENRGVLPPADDQGQQRSGSPVGRTQILAAYGLGGGQQPQQRSAEPEDIYGTLEYRQAFMQFAKTGKVTPALLVGQEARADAMTAVSDVTAVIPSTILNEVVKKMTVYGQVFNRVRKLNIKGGVTVPILSLRPKATWIGEAPTSDKQKVQANTSVTFSYYGLECKVSTSLLADTVTLTGFENVITDLIVEAMVQAVDLAVIKGDGTGKPLGITADNRVPSTQIVTLSPSEFATWDAWKRKVFAKMPLAYKAGATFLMASGTFEGYIDGMVDANGQPVGRVNYGITDGPQERFGGKEVIQVEDDVIAPFDDAAEGDVVAVYCDLRNYGFNSNMQMTMFRYFDHDTNEWVDKAILIADGKLIDPNGVVIVKKGAAT